MDVHSLMFGDEGWGFMPQVVVRALVMFGVISVGLRLMGKRGIKQLSVYELGVIVGLGSAAGDPMFYKDVGLVPAVIVFVVVIAAYLAMERVMEKHDRIAKVLEGKPVELVRDGRLVVAAVEEESLSRSELFAQLRLKSVSNLAQVSVAIVEPTGELSVFFRSDDSVGLGLPLLPRLHERAARDIAAPGTYACAYCGNVQRLQGNAPCAECEHDSWVPAIADKRIT